MQKKRVLTVELRKLPWGVRKMQKKINCSTKPSLNQNKSRSDFQERPLVAQSRKNETPHDNRALWEIVSGLEFNKNCKETAL